MSKLIDVPKVTQRQTNWCWAACCESFTAYYHKKVKTQHEYLLLVGQEGYQLGFARHVHTPSGLELNSTASYTQYVPLLKRILGAEVLAHNYVPTGSASGEFEKDNRYSREQMKGALDNNRPFILNAKNHSRVLCGYGSKPKSETGEEGIFVMDPAVGNYAWEPWDLYLVDSSSMVWLKRGELT